ncbi:hypothetical protein [Pseudogemmobacter bohemicus]|uniref:hypothetical protein n=1 Tax=Pseudogemmobacter bohemicus TaxID=2250708 RepID=UPI000DD34B67|nr:hypothetical protein [Pseudogemmobacter bohemicus]
MGVPAHFQLISLEPRASRLSVLAEAQEPVSSYKDALWRLFEIRPSEGGMLSQNITFELDPIAGRMVTPIYAELTVVYVPVEALEALKNPDGDYPGITEVVRQKFLSGNPLFGIEAENEISKRCRINPRSIAGQKRVSEMISLGHNAAVNFLRTRKYVKATKLLAASTAITPALISRTSLELLNGVLDPDDRINGEVQLSLPTVQLPVRNLVAGQSASSPVHNVVANGILPAAVSIPNRPLAARSVGAGAIEPIFVQLDAIAAGGISLVDLYNAEKKDSLVRVLRGIVDNNPEYGEEIAVRYAHGMSVDSGYLPFILSEQRVQFGRNLVGATDSNGVQENVRRSDMAATINVMVPVPKTELGGVIITFASLKPDETIASQPHPFLSDNWGPDNFLADELALDPVPVSPGTTGQEIIANASTQNFISGAAEKRVTTAPAKEGGLPIEAGERLPPEGPMIVLPSAFPVPAMSDVPVWVRFSTLSPSVHASELRTRGRWL